MKHSDMVKRHYYALSDKGGEDTFIIKFKNMDGDDIYDYGCICVEDEDGNDGFYVNGNKEEECSAAGSPVVRPATPFEIAHLDACIKEGDYIAKEYLEFSDDNYEIY